jgi:hypothetical protein
MPLSKGKSKKTISKNISELMTGAVGPARKKGIATMMKKKGMSEDEARQRMAIAISMSIAKKSKKKGKK